MTTAQLHIKTNLLHFLNNSVRSGGHSLYFKVRPRGGSPEHLPWTRALTPMSTCGLLFNEFHVKDSFLSLTGVTKKMVMKKKMKKKRGAHWLCYDLSYFKKVVGTSRPTL